MTEASFYIQTHGKVQCQLCPHYCIIGQSMSGKCGVRQHTDGKLWARSYGQLVAKAIDPIEKKPLYHFYPGKKILSIGSIGCNLSCRFCQNASISQCKYRESPDFLYQKPEEIIQEAESTFQNIGIAFTYNEPSIWFEYVLTTAELAKKYNLKTAFISNGYINQAPLKQLLQVIDAFNIDLKAFTEKFYRDITKATLSPVLKSLRQIARHDKHLEVTNLIIPELNDNISKFKEMIQWISGELGKDTVLHLSRYFPRYKLNQAVTPKETMLCMYNIAKESLNYVYLGNIQLDQGQDTYCPACQRLAISRNSYHTEILNIDNKGFCLTCNQKIINYL